MSDRKQGPVMAVNQGTVANGTGPKVAGHNRIHGRPNGDANGASNGNVNGVSRGHVAGTTRITPEIREQIKSCLRRTPTWPGFE
ncbi:hypothetical protein N0V88_004088 [Collariella sp. IMI 366227]|nr:hypothetical protein N0V88_004088 [Collariella sp. IMI 366227]